MSTDMYRLMPFLAALSLVAACGRPPAPESAVETELRRGNGGDPGSLDPVLAEDLHAYNVLADLYEGLVVSTADGGVAPGVADSWTVSGDGRTWTFHLRPDARWSNGQPVRASHFVHGFRAALNASSR